MKIPCPPGMRDWYPTDMRRQNWLFSAWRRVSERFGFEEYEGPSFEYLDLYTLKSGPGIVSELFTFEDRGRRRFALRPEMTPTLARMVAAQAHALPRPLKWFCIPRMCRAEKPQRGRLREFFQWNVDILGVEDMLADAEVMAVAVAFFRELGLTPEDVVLRVSSRPIAGAAMASLGLAPEQFEPAFHLIDRYDRLGPDEFSRQWVAVVPQVPADKVLSYIEQADLDRSLELVERAGDAGRGAAAQFRELWERLRTFSIADYCAFDLKVVRGLAYYTGPVFEAGSRRGGLRALLGGGRYDALTTLLDGPPVPAVGFGMGDAPILELLKELRKLPTTSPQLDVFLIDAAAELFPKLLEIAARLRAASVACDFSYKRQPIGKQFGQAAARGAQYAVVVGAELAASGQLTLKDLRTGSQRLVAASEFLANPRAVLGGEGA